ncbi:MAG: glutamate--cysteine ligase [Hyphomicrobiales bacterium]|nr:glutamate--cysteine ligase [Hyphomicrobiales bacterium]
MDIRKYIGSLLTTHGSKIEEWLLAQQRQSIPFFYTSVDIRHAGFKIAPVDTNLFPAGFNILSLEARKIAVEQAKQYVQTYYPNAKTILIIGENHTRNRYYRRISLYFPVFCSRQAIGCSLLHQVLMRRCH